MLDTLKSLINLSNIFLVMVVFFIWFWRSGRRRYAIITGCILGVSFLLSSTLFVPKYLLISLEDKYPVLNAATLDTSKTYYIHVLGSGYSEDERLPALTKLQNSTLARLCEGIRVYNTLPNAVLVTSGRASMGNFSQALIAKNAAVELGVNPKRIEILETPSTTKEEVAAFNKKFGNKVNVIVATDATHISRAVTIYNKAGFKAIAAPTNFTMKRSPNEEYFTLPNVNSIQLSDIYLREFLASLKSKIQD